MRLGLENGIPSMETLLKEGTHMTHDKPISVLSRSFDWKLHVAATYGAETGRAHLPACPPPFPGLTDKSTPQLPLHRDGVM